MKKFWGKRIVIISAALLVLFVCIGMTAFLLFSNYQNVALLKQARNNFQSGDEKSLDIAEAQLLQLVRNDDDNETAYIMLSAIAGKRKVYPEQVYYSYMAHKLNPLSAENKFEYIKSLLFARGFERLENFLSHQASSAYNQFLLYSAGHNGNISKYPFLLERRNPGDKISELALLLFAHDKLSIQEKLIALEKNFKGDDAFLRQEILAAQAELYLESGKIDDAEKALFDAYKLNGFAFAPALGRFYANFRTFGQALEVFEKHLAFYHDQAVAIQTAEIYCLLGKKEKIAELHKQYQADSGIGGMLCSYYLDALMAFAGNDMASLQDLVVPLRKNINTPLAAFMFFCTDVYGGNLDAVAESYSTLLAHRSYLDLQSRADGMVYELLKSSLSVPSVKIDPLFTLAKTLYKRRPDAFTAKFILLVQKQRDSVDTALLTDAMKKFNKDAGIIKIAIEYYLKWDLSMVKELIVAYRQNFPSAKSDMLRYEIILALKNKDFEQASKLFMDNFSLEICPEYWKFASSTRREKDLEFLSRNKLYAPFCQAQLCLQKGDNKTACDLLTNADAGKNLELLFFAAKTLGENGKNHAALKKYALFPPDSSYRIVVLLNMAEIYDELGNIDQALLLANRAYTLNPQMPEAQLCYAGKLYKKGELAMIPDIVKLPRSGGLRERMKPLWIAGMMQRIKNCNIKTQKEKIRELCRQLLVVAPDNGTASEYLKKLNKMQQ